MSTGELVIIFIVAFLVFGPEKLPELARTLGKWLLELRRATQDVKVHMETEFDSTDKETKEEEPQEKSQAEEEPVDKADKNNQ